MSKTIIVGDRQTVFDIALQEYGSIEGVFLVCLDNPAVTGITGDLTPGQTLEIISSPIDKKVVEYYSKNRIMPVTEPDLPVPVPAFLLQEGLDLVEQENAGGVLL